MTDVSTQLGGAATVRGFAKTNDLGIMSAQAVDRLQAIFLAVFELPPGSDATALEQSRTPTWDSIAHVALVTAIESEFGVTLDAVDQLRMTSYEDTLALLNERHA